MSSKTLLFPIIDHKAEMKIEEELLALLKENKKTNLFQTLSYVLKELAGNANKANLKRIHYKLKGLNITDLQDYEKGMSDFKDAINEHYEKYFQNAEALGFYVKIGIDFQDHIAVISVFNNVPILRAEMLRIQEKFLSARKYASIEEVFTNVLDTSEGAGFGFLLMILMLKKAGVGENAIKVFSEQEGTRIEIRLPVDILESPEEEIISSMMVSEIEKIPQFPSHILALEKALSNPNADFKDLAPIIQKDPSLIADLLRTANSVMYALPKKVSSIEEAVKFIGFHGIRNLVMTYSAQKLLISRYKLDIVKEIMEHSAEVSFYAQEIARIYKLKEYYDELYMGGILHDLGKIIAQSIRPDIYRNISRICEEKSIPLNILESMTNGYNHSLIGARLAEKWNFPPSIVSMIKYHHVPLQSEEGNFKKNAVIYIANMIAHCRTGQCNFSEINYESLQFLDIHYQADFEKLYNNLTTLFQKQKN